VCLDFLCNVISETFFIIIKNERTMINNVYLSSRSLPVIVNLYNSFSTLSHNRQVFRNNCTESKCVPWITLQRLSETLFIIIRNELDMIKNVYLSSRSLPVIVNLYNSFSTLSHNRQDLRNNCTESKMCASYFSTTFVWNIFHYNKKWVSYDQKCISVLAQFTGYCQVVQ
jgi:hypothetical protein